MSEEKEVIEPEVVDAKFVEDDRTLKGAPSYVEIPHRAANALEAVAEVVAPFSPEHAEGLRHKAAVSRSLADNVQTAQVAGSKFMDALKDGARKLEEMGLKVEMVKRPTARVARAAR